MNNHKLRHVRERCYQIKYGSSHVAHNTVLFNKQYKKKINTLRNQQLKSHKRSGVWNSEVRKQYIYIYNWLITAW